MHSWESFGTALITVMITNPVNLILLYVYQQAYVSFTHVVQCLATALWLSYTVEINHRTKSEPRRAPQCAASLHFSAHGPRPQWGESITMVSVVKIRPMCPVGMSRSRGFRLDRNRTLPPDQELDINVYIFSLLLSTSSRVTKCPLFWDLKKMSGRNSKIVRNLICNHIVPLGYSVCFVWYCRCMSALKVRGGVADIHSREDVLWHSEPRRGLRMTGSQPSRKVQEALKACVTHIQRTN